jgi:hypothetical protein
MPLPVLKMLSFNPVRGAVNPVLFPDVIVEAFPIATIGAMMTPHPGFSPKHPHPPNPIVMGDRSFLVHNFPVAYLGCVEALGHPVMLNPARTVITRGV